MIQTVKTSSEPTFSALDHHFGRLMRDLAKHPSDELELAAKLTSFVGHQGHICLPLGKISGRTGPIEDLPIEVAETPRLISWIEKLRNTTVVGAPGDFAPLILDDQNRLYLRRYWDYERQVADAILQRVAAPVSAVDLPLLEAGLNRFFPPQSGEIDWQRKAASTALTQNFCVISGGPGTGKTRTVVLIVALLLEQARGRQISIALCAPTGKAAARMKESIQNSLVTLPLSPEVKQSIPSDATTIHRLLGYIPDSPYFRRNRESQLVADVVIVDEASMVDLALMAKLFEAIPVSTKVILLGDKDQLASVESGAVLGDICNSGEDASPAGTREPAALPPSQNEKRRKSRARYVSPDQLSLSLWTGDDTPTTPDTHAHDLLSSIVELKKNHRFGDNSGIFRLNQWVNAGESRKALDLLRAGNASDVVWKKLPWIADLKASLAGIVSGKFARSLQLGSPSETLASLNDFRILCAMKQGPFGVHAINDLVEQVLEEQGLINRENQWYRGRPLIITRNDYNLKLFNGDVGVVLQDEENNGDLRAYFPGTDGGVRRFLPTRLPEHETVYAMTVHKSQGSEFDRLLFILPESDSPMLTRELVYTALTRARQQVELWTNEQTFRLALAKRIERNSGLRDALWRGPGA